MRRCAPKRMNSAHGFQTLEDHTEVFYQISEYHVPDRSRGVRWDDPDLAIPWPLPRERIVLSDKDRRQPLFRELPPYFSYR